eukprot:6131350-Pyramimonas_sp.AAC.2
MRLHGGVNALTTREFDGEAESPGIRNTCEDTAERRKGEEEGRKGKRFWEEEPGSPPDGGVNKYDEDAPGLRSRRRSYSDDDDDFS